MNARYLIRLDDACHTMDRRKWTRVEQVLDAHGVKPIVAVIPENRDPSLMYETPDGAFWDRVRAWTGKGWSVGLHGHTHLMHSTEAALVLPFYKRSEFAGLALETQCEKIRSAWNLFLAEGVEPNIWIAPAHSFDLSTLRAVRKETSIRMVSDGIAWDSYFEHDFHWIPQQLWSLTERRSGLWTVCLHPNTMDDAAIAALDTALGGQFNGRMIGAGDIKLRNGKKTALSRLYNAYFWWRRKNTVRST